MAWLARNGHVSPTERHGRPLTQRDWALFSAALEQWVQAENEANAEACRPRTTPE